MPNLSFSMLKPNLQQFWSEYTIHWINLPQTLSRADVLPSGGFLYPNKLQSQGQVRVYPTRPRRLLIVNGFKWRIIQMMNCTIFSTYIFLKTYKQYIHVFTDLLCENGLANICHIPQNRKYFTGTPVQPILMAVMLVNALTLCCWNPLSNCFMIVVIILTITHRLHQYWTCFYELYLQEINWLLVLWL